MYTKNGKCMYGMVCSGGGNGGSGGLSLPYRHRSHGAPLSPSMKFWWKMQDVGEAGRLEVEEDLQSGCSRLGSKKYSMAAHQNLKPKTPRPNCTNSQPLNLIPELHYPYPSIVHRHQGSCLGAAAAHLTRARPGLGPRGDGSRHSAATRGSCHLD